jgi:hypothetical protein
MYQLVDLLKKCQVTDCRALIMDVNNLKTITTIEIQLHIGKTLHTIFFDIGIMLHFYAAARSDGLSRVCMNFVFGKKLYALLCQTKKY